MSSKETEVTLSTEKSPSHWGFFFVDLAWWLHDSIFQERKFNPDIPTLPKWKFKGDLFHTGKSVRG